MAFARLWRGDCCREVNPIQTPFLVFLCPGEIGLLCALMMIKIITDLRLYYTHSIGNSQEQLEDLDRVGEIVDKSKFSLTVFLCTYLLGRFSNCHVFLCMHRIYIPKK